MVKNIVIACGLGDLFTLLGRVDNFFDENPEYTEIKFFTWLHHPKLAKELAEMYSRGGRRVTIFSVEEQVAFLESVIPEAQIEKAREKFITQNPTGVGVDKYMKFIRTFFPYLEEWIFLPVYEKYKAKYPFVLPVKPAKREKPYIIVHPFSTTVKTEKEERTWNPNKWNWLINKMNEYYTQYDIIVLGTKKDRIEEESCGFSRRVIDMRGKTSLEEAVSLIYGSVGVVGINSWPTFISSWAGMPTYTQWFVQEQLIPSHYPKEVGEMDHLFIEYPIKATYENDHPKAEVVWNNVREVLKDATGLI